MLKEDAVFPGRGITKRKKPRRKRGEIFYDARGAYCGGGRGGKKEEKPLQTKWR